MKDAKGERGTIGVEVKGSIEAVEITIPALANARTTSIYDLGQVIVEWDAEKRTFQFISGIKGTYNKGILSIDAPENLKGEYRALINKNDRTQFLGFYKKDYTTPCTSSGITSGTGTSCKMLCEEGFLPRHLYDEYFCKQFNDIQIYGNCEVLHTTLTELCSLRVSVFHGTLRAMVLANQRI